MKKLFVFVCILLLAFGITGCGKPDPYKDWYFEYVKTFSTYYGEFEVSYSRNKITNTESDLKVLVRFKADAKIRAFSRNGRDDAIEIRVGKFERHFLKEPVFEDELYAFPDGKKSTVGFTEETFRRGDKAAKTVTFACVPFDAGTDEGTCSEGVYYICVRLNNPACGFGFSEVFPVEVDFV